MSKTSLFNSIKNSIALHYGDNPGKMLVHTGVIGWVLSSAAQVVAIIINDKIPKEQKMYMIPQEMADAAVNILSFYAITQTFKSVALKLVNTGKWLPGAVRNFLEKSNIKNVGKKTFDVLKNGNLPKDLGEKFGDFRNGIDVIATTIGSILSCNIVTPVVRNEIAANRQKKSIAKMNAKSQNNIQNINTLDYPKTYMPRPTISTFGSNVYAKSPMSTSSSSLKI